jgi:FkbM family methyltransferase
VTVRRELQGLADSLGVRQHVARYRDQLVRLLTGDHSTAIDQRNWTDEKHVGLLLAFGLRRTANCLDVGANQGLFLRAFRTVAPDGHHIAYEPLPNLFAVLERDYPEIDVRQRALSDTEGECTFAHVLDPQFEGYSGLQERPYPAEVRSESIMVHTERLDDHLPTGWLPDFVKIDVEGAEGLVIAGAIDTLRRARPIMAIEHGWGGSDQFGASDEDFHQVICKDIGLRLFDMDGDGPLDLAHFEDKLATGNHWNWIAHD